MLAAWIKLKVVTPISPVWPSDFFDRRSLWSLIKISIWNTAFSQVSHFKTGHTYAYSVVWMTFPAKYKQCNAADCFCNQHVYPAANMLQSYPSSQSLCLCRAHANAKCGANQLVAFSSLARIWGKCLTIHSLPVFFCFEVEISLHPLIPFFMPGSVHSGSVSWDDYSWMFPDKFHVGSFPDRFPHYAWTVA